MRLLLSLLLPLLLAAGCSTLQDLTGDTADSSTTEPTPTGPTPAPTVDSRSAAPADAMPDIAGIELCANGTRAAIDETIGGQLAAFVAGDFRAALTFATPSFANSFDAASFESMIVTGFPIPASATDHTIISCQQSRDPDAADAAVATVMVEGDGGVQRLQYVLERISGRWLIAGAVPEEDPASGDGQVV